MRPRTFPEALPHNAPAEAGPNDVPAGAARVSAIGRELRLVSRRGYSVIVENDTAWQDAVDAWRALRTGG